VPITFGKYQLQRKLAEGGMAEVFLGRQAGMEGFEKLIVLKRIRPELSSDPNFVNMFLNEARVAARLNHPNIVQIFELGKVDKQYFIAMEFIHGEDLRSLTRTADHAKKHLPAGLTCRIIADTLAGLHYAHTRSAADGKELGLVHRDVSPQNVLVTYEGGVKLVDFGIAKATRGGAVAEQTRAGLFKGKFAYMSPEQSRGQPLDARSDIFAAGILLWEMLTWTRLFKRANDMATLIAVAEEEIPTPLSFDNTLPAEMERICMKALHRKTHMRYQTANEMRADLETLIRTQGWEADSLALQNYMRDVFAEKLRRQEEDIRESGFGSLEDFLLTVDEKTSLSWIKSVAVKTPSSGLPSTRLPGVKLGLAATQPVAAIGNDDAPMPMMAEIDSGGLSVGGLALGGEPEELPGEATSFSPMPVFDDEAKIAKIDPHALGTADTAPVTEIPKELRMPAKPKPQLFATDKEPSAAKTLPPLPLQSRATLPPLGAQPQKGELTALPTAIVSRPSDLPSLPTAIVAPRSQAMQVPRVAPTSGPSATVELSAAAFDASMPATVLGTPSIPEDAGRTLPPGQMHSAMQALSFPEDQTMAREVPQAGALFPSSGTTTAPRPVFNPPSKQRWPLFLVAAVVFVLGAGAVLIRPSAGEPVAMLEINLDQPAVIAVDGKAEPLAARFTVKVKTGVSHVVTVERSGKVVRTLNVPAMTPNEQLQLNVIVP
jgi:serine/threonine protein kinase